MLILQIAKEVAHIYARRLSKVVNLRVAMAQAEQEYKTDHNIQNDAGNCYAQVNSLDGV